MAMIGKERSGITYEDVLKGAEIKLGMRYKLRVETLIPGKRRRVVEAMVTAVYKHHVLLDFGAYRESRRIADIVLGLCDVC